MDALSRNFVLAVEDGLLPLIKNAQGEDEECKLITALLIKGPYADYVVNSGVIYKFDNGNYLLKIPKLMVHDVLAKLHGDGHVSRKRMEILTKQQYDITGLNKRIERLVTNCMPCILATKKAGKKDGYLKPIEKYDAPLHIYHIDHLGPIPSTKKGYKHILVMVDAFTKFNWLYPVKSTKADEALSKLRLNSENFIHLKRIIADKGAAFLGNECDAYCAEHDIELHLITTATPRGNGQVERYNEVIVPVPQ